MTTHHGTTTAATPQSQEKSRLIGLLKNCAAHLERDSEDANGPILYQTLGALHEYTALQMRVMQQRVLGLQGQSSQTRRQDQEEEEEPQQDEHEPDKKNKNDGDDNNNSNAATARAATTEESNLQETACHQQGPQPTAATQVTRVPLVNGKTNSASAAASATTMAVSRPTVVLQLPSGARVLLPGATLLPPVSQQLQARLASQGNVSLTPAVMTAAKIDTTGHRGCVALLRNLGLPQRGNVATLRARLKAHFHLK